MVPCPKYINKKHIFHSGVNFVHWKCFYGFLFFGPQKGQIEENGPAQTPLLPLTKAPTNDQYPLYIILYYDKSKYSDILLMMPSISCAFSPCKMYASDLIISPSPPSWSSSPPSHPITLCPLSTFIHTCST